MLKWDQGHLSLNSELATLSNVFKEAPFPVHAEVPQKMYSYNPRHIYGIGVGRFRILGGGGGGQGLEYWGAKV